MKYYLWGSGGIAPQILTPTTGFKFQSLYARGQNLGHPLPRRLSDSQVEENSTSHVQGLAE
jgi:hypothetical protein